jgi:hypothetical protein
MHRNKARLLITSFASARIVRGTPARGIFHFWKLNASGAALVGCRGVRSLAHVDLGHAIRVTGEAHFIPRQLRQADSRAQASASRSFTDVVWR